MYGIAKGIWSPVRLYNALQCRLIYDQSAAVRG
jgi:hypothetical protein